MVLAGGGNGRIDGQFQPCLQPEQVRHLPGFPEKLAVVGKMLVLASAAGAEQAAAGLHAVRAGVKHFHQVRGGIILVVAPDAGLHAVSRQGEGDENHPAVHTADAVARIGKGVNVQFKLLMVGKRFRVEALGNGRSHGEGKEKGYGAEGVISLPSRSYSRVSGSRGVRSPGRKSPGNTAGPGTDSAFSSCGRMAGFTGAGAQGAGRVRRGGLFRLNGWGGSGFLRRRFLVGGTGSGPGQPGNQTGADQELFHGADSYSFIRAWQSNFRFIPLLPVYGERNKGKRLPYHAAQMRSLVFVRGWRK